MAAGAAFVLASAFALPQQASIVIRAAAARVRCTERADGAGSVRRPGLGEMADIERGLQWWVRYALVPVLGSGGVAAAVVAYINRPDATAKPEPAAAAAPASVATAQAATA